jgi:hypothetical protein
MNNFTQHGISHLSASSINAYAEDPAYWTAKYLLGAKFPFSAPARGGTIVEKAIVECLQGKDKTIVIDNAIAEYNKATIFDKSDAVAKWSSAMRDMIEMGAKELELYGAPKFELDGSQKKILIDCNMGEYKVPIIGFLDLFYPEKKIVVDIKCTFRCPSEMSASHKRQAAIYQLSNADCQIGFLYITPKKTQWFWVQDVAEQITEIKGIIRRMNGMLGIGDKDKIKEIIPIVDSYYWSDCMETRKQLFGF